MSRRPKASADPNEEPTLKANFLDPDDVRFERMVYGGLSLRLDGETHEHLRVYRVFPLTQPDKYISIRVGDSELVQREIGQIRDVRELSPENRALLAEELQKRYFVHTIEKIVSIRDDMGFFYWDVETDKGHREFPVPIRARHVAAIGPRGRLVSDVDGNRYSIPDLEELDFRSRSIFDRNIYW